MKKIKFYAFLEKAKKNSFWEDSSFYGFHGEEYSILFFSLLFSFLKKKNIVSFDFAQRGAGKDFLPSLRQQFLGEKKLYWLGQQVDQVAKKNKREIVKFLSGYNGPNVVGCFFSDASLCKEFQPSDSFIVQLEQVLNYDTFLVITDFFELKYSVKKKAQLKKFFDGSDGLTLDVACILFNYLDVAGIRTSKDLEHYVNIVNPFSGSLFSLSQYFFSKDATHFFPLWSKMFGTYPDIFWISYWSDQLWRAYNVVTLLTHGKNREARRFSFRLPYSFANKDWKGSSSQELINAYDFLFKTDYGLKRGSSYCSLDLFFGKYFEGAFQ